MSASELGVASRSLLRGALLYAALACAATSSSPAATVRGVLVSREDGQPLPYGNVRLLDLGSGIGSGQTGRFEIRGVPVGDHILCVSLIGYRPLRVPIQIAQAESVAAVLIELEPVAFALREVSIRAPARAAPGTSTEVLSREEIARLPGTGDDLFRAIQTLPGVVSTDIAASFRIRGGASDETLVRLDGFNLPEPYHIRDVSGALSIVSLDAVGSARLQAGGLPARYAEHLSGALEIDSESELPPHPIVRVRAGVTQAGAQVGGPLGRIGSYLLASRHGLLDAVFRSYRVNPHVRFEPGFDDALAIARLRPARAHEVELFLLAARDDLLWDDTYDGNDTSSRQRSATAGVRWTDRWSDRANHRVILSGDYLNRRRLLAYTGRDDNLTRAVRARMEESVTLSASQMLEMGVAWEWERSRLDFREANVKIVGGMQVESILSVTRGTAIRRRSEGFVSLHSRWGERTSTTAGLNVGFDNYDWGLAGDSLTSARVRASFGLGPRLSVAHRIGGGMTIRAAAGVLRQPAFLNNLDIVRIKLPLGRVRQAEELVAGVDFALLGWPLRVEGYRRSERGYDISLNDLLSGRQTSPVVASGLSRGLEIFARTPSDGWLSGWGSYTLANATWNLSGREVSRDFDERHSAILSLSARTIGKWTITAIARYHGGDPYTSDIWVSPDQRYNWHRIPGPEMATRYPDYFRADFRLSHPIGGAIPGGFYFELINATNHRNVFLYTWDFEALSGGGFTPTRQTINLFPRVPSAGFEFRL